MIYIEQYSDDSYVVRGDTQPHKEQLKQLGAKPNSGLVGGPGYIFHARRYRDIEDYVYDATGGSPVERTQPVTYILPKPHIGQKVDLYVWEPLETIYYYVVDNVESSQPQRTTGKSIQIAPIDIVYIIPENGSQEETLNALVVSGRFQIVELADEHEIVFIWE